jgi:hypothetical protein
MNTLDHNDSPVATIDRRWVNRKARLLLILAALFAIGAGVAAVSIHSDDKAGSGISEINRGVVLGAWCLIALAYAINRFRPRSADSEAAMRPKAEAFSVKRSNLLIATSLFVALGATPIAAMDSVHRPPNGTIVDALFVAVILVGPCGVLIGLMTGGIYSKALGAAADDELTSANRADAFRLGFAVFVVAAIIAYVGALIRPDWAPAMIPAVLGLGVAAMGLRFARLEQVAARGT